MLVVLWILPIMKALYLPSKIPYYSKVNKTPTYMGLCIMQSLHPRSSNHLDLLLCSPLELWLQIQKCLLQPVFSSAVIFLSLLVPLICSSCFEKIMMHFTYNHLIKTFVAFVFVYIVICNCSTNKQIPNTYKLYCTLNQI